MAPTTAFKKAMKNAVGLQQQPPVKAKTVKEKLKSSGLDLVLLDEDHVKKFHVHKESFLRKVPQLSKDLNERNEVTIHLDEKMIPKVIDYVYINEIDFENCSSYDLNALVVFATDYGLDSLADEVGKIIVDKFITIDNCCRYMNQTCISKQPRIHDACYQLVVGNFAEIVVEELCFLPAEYLNKAMDDLKIANEDQVEITAKWRKMRDEILG